MTAIDRLLILATHGRDAQVIAAQLEGIEPVATIATPAMIVQAVGIGELGAAIVTDEAMAGFDLAALTVALAAQPPWSDSPFLVLTQHEFGGWTRAQLATLLGNVSILERPLRSDVLIAGVRSALRARARQRRAQIHILAREEAEAQVRELAATLETRVHERTVALSKATAETAQTERRLRDSEALYRSTVELTAHTPWTSDPDGQMLNVAQGWANPTGSHASFRDRIHDEDRDASLVAWAAARKSGTPYLSDFRLRGEDGALSWCRSRATPRFAPDGSIERWYGTLENIDERHMADAKLRQMQAELIHVSRLSAMGAMASTLAHELNQPLTAITNYVRGIRRMLDDHPDFPTVSHALEMTDRSAVRAGEIVRRVRDLVTKGDVERQPENLSALIREACSLAMIDAHSTGIDFRLELAPAPMQVLVDRIQIQQVLLNLLRNAAEAVSDSPQRLIVVRTTVTTDEFCEVTVSDSGPGLAAESAARLFEPFNTTKSNGMGIGLSISRTIIEGHGGVIWHRAGATGGAVFSFSLVRAPITALIGQTVASAAANG